MMCRKYNAYNKGPIVYGTVGNFGSFAYKDNEQESCICLMIIITQIWAVFNGAEWRLYGNFKEIVTPACVFTQEILNKNLTRPT